jgi:predicted nucleotidyltransferase
MDERALPVSFPPETVAAIDTRLAAIRDAHAVAIPLAIESGSRAWGFPSPDSDFDARFIFVRPVADYLTPWQRRDVIETPIEGEFDVNGWELGKALKLLLKGNAVVIEWLTSPITYSADAAFRAGLLELASRHADRGLIGRHYLHLGERQRRVYFADGKRIRLKKIFYALRPAAALRWLRAYSDRAVAPMHFPTLMNQCDPPAEVAAIVTDLIARKAVSRELGAADLPAPIAAFIDAEFDAARALFERPAAPPSAEAIAEAEHFFRVTTTRLDRAAPPQ